MDIRISKAIRLIHHGHGYVTLLAGNEPDVRIYSMEVANDTFQSREEVG